MLYCFTNQIIICLFSTSFVTKYVFYILKIILYEKNINILENKVF